MRVAKKSLLIGCICLAVAWAWWALVVFRPVLPEGASAIATLFGYAFILGHVAAFCAMTTGAVFGVFALVRHPDVRVFRGYFIVGITALLWIFLAFIIVVAFPRLA